MELQLQAAEGCALPLDTYIRVKIGNTTKQQRYDSKTAFSFPSVVQRHRATLDVFRRIGTCEVEVDPAATGIKNVAVVSTESGQGAMRLKLDVQPAAPTNSKGMVKSADNITSAKAYIAEHDIEQMLQNVVQHLLDDRPANPKEYICTYVREGKPPLDFARQQPIPPPLERPSSADGRQKLPPLDHHRFPPAYSAPTSSPAPASQAPPAPENPADAGVKTTDTESAEDALAAAQASLAAASKEDAAKEETKRPAAEDVRKKARSSFESGMNTGKLEGLLAGEDIFADQSGKNVRDEDDDDEVDMVSGRPSLTPGAEQLSSKKVLSKANKALADGTESGSLQAIMADKAKEDKAKKLNTPEDAEGLESVVE
jgi:hypothetical protein